MITWGMSRQYLGILARYVFGVVLVWWLINSNLISIPSWGDLSVSFLFAASILGVLVTALSTLRIHALLEAQAIHLDYLHCFRINSIGLFYSLFLPGGVSGDAARAVYFFRDAPAMRPVVLGALMIDRFLGMITLITLGLVSGVLLLSVIPDILPWLLLASLVLVVLVALLAMTLRYEIQHRETLGAHRLLRYWERIRGIYVRLNLKQYSHRSMLVSTGLSIAMNLAMIVLIFICSGIHEAGVGPLQVATVAPLGLLTNAIPLSPGGLGIGEKSFEVLYGLMGGQNGASAFLLARFFLYSPAILGGLLVAVELFQLRTLRHKGAQDKPMRGEDLA